MKLPQPLLENKTAEITLKESDLNKTVSIEFQMEELHNAAVSLGLQL